MQSTRARVGVLGVAVAAIVVLFVVLNGDDNSSTTTATSDAGGSGSKPVTLAYKNGEVQGGEQDLSYTTGDRIRIEVESDVESEAHLHGYNVELEVGPDKPASFHLTAGLEGVFDLELHLPNGEVGLASVSVNP